MKKIIKYSLVLMLILFNSKLGLSQFTEPITINSDNYGPKLILNDPNTANKVPIEYRTNNEIKWELGMRPISGENDLALWNYNSGSYSPVMWFKYSNGNVGIGTNSPSTKLTINGSHISGKGLLNLNSLSGHIAAMTFYQGNTYSGAIFAGTDNDMYFGTEGTDNLKFYTNNVNNIKMVINSNGNIGIGTVSPSTKLSIVGSHISGEGLLKLNSSSGHIAAMTFHQGNSYSGAIFAGTDNDMYFGTEGADNLKFYTNNVNNVKMVISSSGSVGIGTTETGSHKLAVEGTIGAREIKVEADTWSDFVFNKDYELKDLKEVENFIEENNHLPDIPSEKEVLENGVALGEMDAKLLQKIEELTLYMIEQNKKTKTLIEKVEVLESENKELKEKISTLTVQ